MIYVVKSSTTNGECYLPQTLKSGVSNAGKIRTAVYAVVSGATPGRNIDYPVSFFHAVKRLPVAIRGILSGEAVRMTHRLYAAVHRR